MKKQPKMILAALALLAFITIFRPVIEYLFPEMPANYAILLRKGLQALTVIAYVAFMKLRNHAEILPIPARSLSQQGECTNTTKKAERKGLELLVPVVVLSFSSYLYGFKNLDLQEFLITLLICLLIGVIEETSLRGILYSAVQPYGATAAVIVSSAVFALVHIPNMLYNKDVESTLYQVAFAFGFGLIMAVVRYKTDLLLPQLIVHALWDFNVKITNTSLSIPLADTINFISEVIVVLLGLVLMTLVIKENSRKKTGISASI